jgi:hypothetical protein
VFRDLQQFFGFHSHKRLGRCGGFSAPEAVFNSANVIGNFPSPEKALSAPEKVQEHLLLIQALMSDSGGG